MSRITSNVLRVVDNSASLSTTPITERHDCSVIVKTGCLRVNPLTERGRRLYVAQMLLLCFLPHAALIAQNCTIMAQLSAAFDASWYLYSEVTEILTLAEVIMAVQDERHEVGNHLFAETKHSGEADINRLVQAFTTTNAILESAPPALLADGLRMTLYHLREDARSNTYARGRDSYKRMSVYDDIGSVCLLSVETQVKFTTSALWRMLLELPGFCSASGMFAQTRTDDFYAVMRKRVAALLSTVWVSPNPILTTVAVRQLAACFELVRSREKLSRAHLDLQYLTSIEELDPDASVRLASHLASGVDHLAALVQYLKAEQLEYEEVQEIIYYYKTSPLFNETSKMSDFRSKGLKYAKESNTCLDRLRRFQYGFRSIVRKSVQQEVSSSRWTLGVGVGILVVVLVSSPVLLLLLQNTMSIMQSFSTSIATTTQRLMAEKQKSDLLLSRMLPMPVLQRLRAQKTVPAEAFDAVTIFFSDIVGFTSISANSTPMEVINMLNMLYRLFDEKITQYNVYKVETIGDAYMAVSGLPQRNGNRHASEIADMSLSLMKSLDGATVPHCPGDLLKIRAGVNTGPCVAGVVGTSMPRYCLFGDTINTASRMESTGEAMKIHISDTTKRALDEIGGYEVESRGIRDIPGKGEMETFWLVGKLAGIQHDSPRGPRLKDYDQEFLEMLIS